MTHTFLKETKPRSPRHVNDAVTPGSFLESRATISSVTASVLRSTASMSNSQANTGHINEACGLPAVSLTHLVYSTRGATSCRCLPVIGGKTRLISYQTHGLELWGSDVESKLPRPSLGTWQHWTEIPGDGVAACRSRVVPPTLQRCSLVQPPEVAGNLNMDTLLLAQTPSSGELRHPVEMTLKPPWGGGPYGRDPWVHLLNRALGAIRR